MSRIPIPSSHSDFRLSPPSPPPPPSPMSQTGSYQSTARSSPASSRPRPDSIYSASNLSASTAPTSADGSLTETRKRQNKRDEVSSALFPALRRSTPRASRCPTLPKYRHGVIQRRLSVAGADITTPKTGSQHLRFGTVVEESRQREGRIRTHIGQELLRVDLGFFSCSPG